MLGDLQYTNKLKMKASQYLTSQGIFFVNTDHLVGMTVKQKTNKEYNNIFIKVSSILKAFSTKKIDLDKFNKIIHSKK